jgi:hypothetical protein
MRGNLTNIKKLMPIQIINNAGLSDKNIVNSVINYNDCDAMNSDFKE